MIGGFFIYITSESTVKHTFKASEDLGLLGVLKSINYTSIMGRIVCTNPVKKST